MDGSSVSDRLKEFFPPESQNTMPPGLSLGAGLLLSPFGIISIVQGRLGLGGLLLASVLVLSLNALSALRRNRPLVNSVALLVPLMGANLVSVLQQGAVGVYWAYPIVVCLYFVLERRLALLLSLGFLACLLPAAVWVAGWGHTFFMLVTLTLTGTLARFFAAAFQQQAQLRFQQQAQLIITDPLTQLFNRRYLDSCLETAISQYQRYGITTSLLMFDLDHFKQVNDQFGHHTGDQVLRHVAEMVRTRTRQGDQVFRYGGEEFVILLPATPVNQAQTLAEALRHRLATTPVVKQEVSITMSGGLSELHFHDSPDSWLERCDQALYEAKRLGRDRVVVVK